MIEDDEDDDDDRRSIVSSTSFAFSPHQLEFAQSAYAGHLSPFSPQSILSTHSFESNLTFMGIGDSSGSLIPRAGASSLAYEDGAESPIYEMEDSSSSVAPFRRNLDEEREGIIDASEGDDRDALEQYLSDAEGASTPMRPAGSGGHSNRPSVTFPTLGQGQKESFIHFPGSSSPDGADSPRPLRSRVSSFATEGEASTPPFLRSRLPSRLAPEIIGGWRTRRDSSA
jgi:1-phosphatidylinositol-3-phosphate 5-kinase